MEDQVTTLLQSVKNNFPLIKFEIVNNAFSPTLKHFVIKENNKIKGFASGHCLKLTVEKAYSEFIERKTLFALNSIFSCFKTSNGFAAHLNFQKAKNCSLYEIIERDAFLLSWHGQIAPYWLSFSEITNLLSEENLIILTLHSRYKLSFRFGILASSNASLTAIGLVECLDEQRSFYIDCKSGPNMRDLANALIESVTYHSHYIIKGYRKRIQFKKNQLQSPMDHFDYYLKARKEINWFFKGRSDVFEFLPNKIFSYNCNVGNLIGKKNLNRSVCFSESNQMQDYYCGKLLDTNYNRDRFLQVFGETFIPNTQVHPLS